MAAPHLVPHAAASFVPSQTCQMPSFLHLTLLSLCGNRSHSGLEREVLPDVRLFGQQASRRGLSPAFYVTAGPVPCACLVVSCHGGFSGSRLAPNTAGVVIAAQLLPGRSVEVLGWPWGAE